MVQSRRADDDRVQTGMTENDGEHELQLAHVREQAIESRGVPSGVALRWSRRLCVT